MVLKCEEAGCGFVGQTKVRLVNHIKESHGRMARVMEICPFRKRKFHKQRLPMHTRYCRTKPNKGGAI